MVTMHECKRRPGAGKSVTCRPRLRGCHLCYSKDHPSGFFNCHNICMSVCYLESKKKISGVPIKGDSCLAQDVTAMYMYSSVVIEDR